MKLSQLRVKNFRTIGAGDSGNGVSINIDNNIIFILGKNNAGKSSLLNAYDVFVSNTQITENDFFNKDLSLEVEIEMQLKADSDEERQLDVFSQAGITSIKKTWKFCEGVIERSTFRLLGEEWLNVDDKDKKGKDKIKRLEQEFPETIWIRGMETSEDVVSKLKKLVQKSVLQTLKDTQTYKQAQEAVQKLQEMVSYSETSASISISISQIIQEVFPAISLNIDSYSNDIDLIKMIQDDTKFMIQENDLPVTYDMQGHGVQRQLIFSTLKVYSKQLKNANSNTKSPIQLDNITATQASGKKYMILLEEPELFLHPTAIRSIRNLLYDLAKNSEFQFMCATHSPVIIDLNQSKSSLVRVVKVPDKGSVAHQLQSEELINPRMLEEFNSHVCEAFFADRVILVEGSTEVVAIKCLLDKIKKESEACTGLSDFHIVNCGGKTTIPGFQKILRLFRIDYFVFHDSDSPKDTSGRKLNVWTINDKIWDEIEAARKSQVDAKRFVSIVDFESANGYNPYPKGKPSVAYDQVRKWVSRWDDDTVQSKPIVKYLMSLVDEKYEIEDHTSEWLHKQNIEDVSEDFLDEQLELDFERFCN